MSEFDPLPIDIAQRIDRFCDQFEQSWRADQDPRIEQFLDQWHSDSEYRPLFFEELLRVELDLLRETRDSPSAKHYTLRFPEFTEVIQKVFTEQVEDQDEMVDTFIVNLPKPSYEIPKQIGRYKIQHEIGRGAFGVVYLAEDPQLECLVAIKQLNVSEVAKAAGVARLDASQIVEDLLREARVVARLRQYQGIVAILDVLTTSSEDSVSNVYFVQDYIDGGDLKDLLVQGPVSPFETARILQLVSHAMNNVHEHGIYHRDLKPANIILDANANPFVVDFGLAIDEKLQKGRRGEISGTVPYMAPEQTRGEVHLLDGRADIWALGVILYEMLTRQRPFHGATLFEISENICRSELTPPRTINSQIPGELERICLKCLSKRMTDRYPSAMDLSDDLHEWMVEYESDTKPSSVEEGQSKRVISKGLRSFDQEDADFFLELLPGPRDRKGLPESIRFWKQRIEEKDPDKTFRIGLMYGPSGCGKSSLVKAGLLPNLNRTIPIYVESTAADTEVRILGQLRKIVPQLSRDLSLPEAIIELREHPELTGFKKIVLVLDQFEQWLQSRRTFGREQLIEALRQSDGARLQVLILVRDDFWMAVTRFLHELEIDLVPEENVAAVDLFPPSHASKVLTEFGRAYGKIGEHEQPTKKQQEFIDKVVEGISRDGTVVCVRLTIFAEMVKNKEWIPQTIDQVGGTDGIGESFLEEAFSSRAANPKNRVHEQAARKVLQALLPEVGTNIKGHMRSQHELLEVSGYQNQPKDFEELLRILDGELRLITPTDPEGQQDSQERDETSGYYQLTHDYLVPSLREWLTRQQRATRKGRAQLLMRELAEAWQLKPDSRKLPSPMEWLSIVRWTTRAERTKIQQEMVRTTSRRLSGIAALWFIGIVLLSFAGYQTNGRFQARAVVDRLESADTTDLPLVMADVLQYRTWVEPLIKKELAEAETLPKAEDPAREQRRKMHLNLSLAVLNASDVQNVLDDIGTIPVDDLQVVSGLLQAHAQKIEEDLWKRFQAALDENSPDALKVAALLASVAPNDERWEPHLDYVANELIIAPGASVSYWTHLMRPLRTAVAPALVKRLNDAQQLPAAQRKTLIDLIADYGSSSPDVLVTAVEFANPSELPQLFRELDDHKDAGLVHIATHAKSLDSVGDVADLSLELSDKTRQIIENAMGLSETNGIFVQRLPRTQFDDLDGELQTAGYQAISVRPFRDEAEMFVAAAWQPNSGESEIQWDLTLDQIESTDQEMRKRGLLPVDFSRYPKSDTTDMQWVVVWATPQGEAPETRFLPAVALSEYRQQVAKWPEAGFSISRFDTWIGSDGEPSCSVIWTQTGSIVDETFADWKYTRAFGDLAPGAFQSDFRFEWIPPQQRDTLGIYRHLSTAQQAESVTPKGSKRDTKLLAMSKYYSLMGEYEKAREILKELLPRWTKTAFIREYLGVLNARSNNRKNLLLETGTYENLPKADPAVASYLKLRAAVLAEDSQAVADHLQELEQFAPESSKEKDLLARAYAILVPLKETTDEKAILTRQSVSQIQEQITAGLANPEILFFDVDFDTIRDSNEFRELFRELEFHQRLTTSYSQSADVESRQLWGLDLESHRVKSQELLANGFQPHVVQVRKSAADGELQCCSVWHRPVAEVSERVRNARRKSNLLLAATRLGNWNEFRTALTSPGQPEIRSHLTLTAPAVLPVEGILQSLEAAATEQEIQSLILILGAISFDQLEKEEQINLVRRAGEFSNNKNSGIRSAVQWSLRQWRVEAPVLTNPDEATANEYRNSVGQRMIVLTPPEQLLMGSPQWEADRSDWESRYWINIPRQYSLCETETTRGEFHAFLQDERVLKYYAGDVSKFRGLSPGDRTPVVGVKLRDAALFCQWLSEQDSEILESQYCYPGIWDVDAESFSLPENYLQRIGYRLPTEAEWEWAARAGVMRSSRFSGDDVRTLGGYAWFGRNSLGTLRPTGELRPNGLGFFDMLGNVSEWCDDLGEVYRRPLDGYYRSDKLGNKNFPGKSDDCVPRGGSYKTAAEELRSANRSYLHAKYYSSSVGFRVARTGP